MKLSDIQIETFNNDGFLVIENYISDDQIRRMTEEIRDVVRNQDFTDFNHIFSCADSEASENYYHDEYFLTSWDKIRFFLEPPKSTNENHLITNDNRVINKIGHNLHNILPAFKEVSYDKSVKSICQQLGFSEPAICQSMYIFKSAKHGSAVTPHQDASFLWTEPECRILGFWIALEDATLENGCLWAVPGSHKDGLLNNVRFVRDPSIGPFVTKLTADYPEFNHEQYKPLIVSKGSLVLIHGFVLHKSLANTSDSPRDIYTWHIVDISGTKWHKSNWIQPPNGINDFQVI